MSEEKPPIGKSWNNLYLLLVLILAVLIAGFYLFEKHFQ
jgi:hypothetical protein